MATKAYYPISEIGAGKVGFSRTRSIIEGAFYGNNVVKVSTLKEAYELAKNSPRVFLLAHLPYHLRAQLRTSCYVSPNPEFVSLGKSEELPLSHSQTALLS